MAEPGMVIIQNYNLVRSVLIRSNTGGTQESVNTDTNNHIVTINWSDPLTDFKVLWFPNDVILKDGTHQTDHQFEVYLSPKSGLWTDCQISRTSYGGTDGLAYMDGFLIKNPSNKPLMLDIITCDSKHVDSDSEFRLINSTSITAPWEDPATLDSPRCFINLGASPMMQGHYSLNVGGHNQAIGNYSSTLGYHCVARGDYSHAEGENTVASGLYAHAEGYQTTANGKYAHAEGKDTSATSTYTHAEGLNTFAIYNGSHAEGNNTTASGSYSHAEGFKSTSSGSKSHAGGHITTASNECSFSMGHLNKDMTTGGQWNNTVGDAFVIGNGIYETSLSNAFRVTFAGAVYGVGSFHTSGADYAEFFEWLDGNPEDEDRIGLFVTLKGRKILPANPGDYILGVISGNPAVVGNGDEDWLGRWQHDAYDRFIKEYLENDYTLIDTSNMSEEERIELEGDPEVEFRDDQYYRVTARVVDYETPSWRHKANPNYDPNIPYIERKDRKEWDYVGMMGVLSVRDDNTCEVDGYARISQDGCVTRSDLYIPGETYRVVERVQDGVVRVIVK